MFGLAWFAWFFNPILSLWRFRKVRRIGMRTADWCFDAEKNIDIFATRAIPYLDWASFELHHPNSVYGNAKALKNYANLPDVYPIKVSYSHGVTLTESFFDPKSNLHFGGHNYYVPAFLAWGNFERSMMERYHPDNKVYVIGAPFLYADNFFSEEYINNEKARLGRNLLVFPGHSSYSYNQNVNIDEFIIRIEEYKSMFDSIRICIYWKDVQCGLHRLYLERGYECVCSGHTEDCNFVSRLKGLLSVCDATITNQISTHVGYSIAMNKPVKVCDFSNVNDITFVNPSTITIVQSHFNSLGYKSLNKLLVENDQFVISEEIREAVEPYWGLCEKKTKEELRQIFFDAEKLFQKSPYRHRFWEFR
jgi:hypothetical protein